MNISLSKVTKNEKDIFYNDGRGIQQEFFSSIS